MEQQTNNVYHSIQGNIGFGKAIEYFTSNNIHIAIPLNDTQKYDLIADFNGGLQRISVKTSRNTTNNGKSYYVMLRNCGGSSGNLKVRNFDNSTCDYIFIYTANNKMYLIPSNKITAINSICVGEKYKEYEVFSKTFSDYVLEL